MGLKDLFERCITSPVFLLFPSKLSLLIWRNPRNYLDYFLREGGVSSVL